jgi:ABC-type multidrug transport system fused ATPase/permease subunit
MVPSGKVVRSFSLFRQYLGRRLYVVSVLTLLAAATEGLGIALLLPVLSLLGVTGGAAAETDTASAVEGVVHDVAARIGIEQSMAGLLAFVSLVFLVKGLLKFSEGAYKSHLRAQLAQEVQSKLFTAYASIDYGYYSRHSAGHFANLISVQVPRLVTAFERHQKFLAALITVVAYFVFAFLISWPLASMATGVGLVMALTFRRLTGRVRRWSRDGAVEYGTLSHFMVQTMQAYKYLTSTARMPSLSAEILRSIGRLAGYQRKKEIAWSFTESLQEPMAVGVLVLVIVVQIAWLDQSLGPVVVGLVLIYRAMGQLVLVQAHWQATMQEVGSLEIVGEEVRSVARHQQLSGTIGLPPLSRGIVLQNVSFAYEASARPVLENVSLTIPANRTVAIVGESGSGKTTFVDMLTLVLRPQHGTLSIDGVPHWDVETESWRAQIGYVSQDLVVFDDTVANNIALWRGDYAEDAEVRRHVEQAAVRAGAKPFIDALPDGFLTRVGDRGVRLSGGQRQRLFIARELYKNPRLLILDEATSALDSDSEMIVKETLEGLRGSTTVVIIAHRLATIRHADHIYVLAAGRVVEDGTYDALAAAHRGEFHRMVALQRL